MSERAGRCAGCGTDLSYLRAGDFCLACGSRCGPSLGVRLDRRVGPYTLIELVGEGASHEVWKAVHAAMGRPVTLKLSHSPSSPELEVWKGLEHPGLARLLGTLSVPLEDKSVHAEIWEWAPGLSLRNRFNLARQENHSHAHLYLGDIQNLLEILFSALQFLHAQNIAHGDVRAENVVVQQTVVRTPTSGLYRPMFHRTLKLIDPAPQAALDRDQVLLGILIFELLTGRLPVAGCSWPEERCPFLGKGLDDVLRRAMGVGAGRPFADLVEMERELKNAFARGTGYDFTLFHSHVPGYEDFYCESDYFS